MAAWRNGTLNGSRIAAWIVGLAALAALACPVAAVAQPRPPRAFQGLFGTSPPADPDRTSQQLTLTGNLLAGVDSAAGREETPLGELETDTGYSGVAQVALTYWRGRSGRSFTVTAHTGAVTYSTIDEVVVPEVGLDVRGQTDLGRSSSVTAGQSVAYLPYYNLGSFNAILHDLEYVGAPDVASSYGVLDYPSVSYRTSAGFNHRWTRAQSSEARYRFHGRHYLDEPALDGLSRGDQQVHMTSLRHSIGLGRDWSVNGSYSYSHGSYDLSEDARRPLDSHGVHAGVSYDRRLSPRRELSLSAAAGATYARTHISGADEADQNLERRYWKPTYRASASIDTWRYWSLWATYRRTFNVLNALDFDTYYGDHFVIGTGGLVSRRINLSFRGGVSTGESLYGGEPGRRDYQNYVFSAESHYALSQNVALMARYYYYYYDVGASALLLPGLPSRLDRQGVQVGLSFWWPLSGRRGQPIR